MPTPQEISAALAFARDEATPEQLRSLGSHPQARTSEALAILAEVHDNSAKDATGAALETVARLLLYVVGPKSKHTPRRSYARGIELRAVALLWVIRPDYLQGRSLDATADSMGISRQMFDRHVVAIGRLVRHANGSMRPATPRRKESSWRSGVRAGSAEGHNPSMN